MEIFGNFKGNMACEAEFEYLNSKKREKNRNNWQFSLPHLYSKMGKLPKAYSQFD